MFCCASSPLDGMSVDAGMMIKVDNSGQHGRKNKRKREAVMDDNQAPAKAAKIDKEKKLESEQPRGTESDVTGCGLKNHQIDARKLKKVLMSSMTNGNKPKPKMVREISRNYSLFLLVR